MTEPIKLPPLPETLAWAAVNEPLAKAVQAYTTAAIEADRAALQSQPISVDALAQEIRRVDGQHALGAGSLAEALMPFIQNALPPHDREDAYIPKKRMDYVASITDSDPHIAQREGYTEGWNDCRQDVIDHARRVENRS